MEKLKYKLVHPDLHTVLLVSLISIVIPLVLLQAAIGYYLIDHYVIKNAQQQAESYIHSARSELNNQIQLISKALSIVENLDQIALLKEKLELDYLYVVALDSNNTPATELMKSDAIARAFKGTGSGGFRIMDEQELALLGNELAKKAVIKIETPDNSDNMVPQYIREAMVLEYAMPFYNKQGLITHVLCGGIIINNRIKLIDTIHQLVFEDRLYSGKPIGTVTIFKDKVRIATNVLDKYGKRAIGTFVSPEVYESVMIQGKSWFDRAFVVTDWYLTAYEPIVDLQGNRLGMLYVGILEKPFVDLKKSISLIYIILIVAVIILAVVSSMYVSQRILKPVSNLLHATERLSSGDLEYRIELQKSIKELDVLAEEFNNMAQKLKDREANLQDTNKKLLELNKSYLDLVNIVSHDIKGVLASAVMNVCSIKDEFLGPINEDQKKAITSIARTLDYLTSTVRRILDLGRIEKGELVLHPSLLNFNKDIIKHSLEAFERQIQEKDMHVENNLSDDITFFGDPELLLIAVNNLIGNAVTYGLEHGNIVISSRKNHSQPDTSFEIEVYNDSKPITQEQMEHLFQKFSRLEHEPGNRYQGTGLGLYITKEILAKHNASIRAESREHGNAFIITFHGMDKKITANSS